MEEEEQHLVKNEDRRDTNEIQQDNYVQQRRSYQQSFMQVEYGNQRLSTIEEHQNETKEDDMGDNEKIKKITYIYIALIAIYLILILIVVLLFFLSEDFREGLVKFFAKFKEPTPDNIMILFLIGVLVKVTGFPITIYELTVAYVQQNFYLSLCILASSKTTGCYLSFLISQYNFAQNAYFWIQTVKELKVIGLSAEKHPQKISFLVRFMWLPIVVKNYGLGLFKISSLQFLIPTILHCTIKSSFLCFVGINLSSFYDVVSGETLADNILIKIFVAILSLVLFLCLFFLCKKEYDLLEKEVIEQEKERKRLSTVSTDIVNLLNRQSQVSEKPIEEQQ